MRTMRMPLKKEFLGWQRIEEIVIAERCVVVRGTATRATCVRHSASGTRAMERTSSRGFGWPGLFSFFLYSFSLFTG